MDKPQVIEVGVLNSSDQVVFEDMIIKDCERIAVKVSGGVEEYDPFIDRVVPDEVERLNITFRNVDFMGNSAKQGEATSGAISIGEEVNAHVIGCRFEKNEGISGGAIGFTGRFLAIENTTFVENAAEKSGGAVFARHPATADNENTKISINGCHFTRNRVPTDGEDQMTLSSFDLSLDEDSEQDAFKARRLSGGALYLSDYHTVVIEKCTFSENSAVSAGGALNLNAVSRTSFMDCVFRKNSVLKNYDTNLQQGGAIFSTISLAKSGVDISRCLFSENRAAIGGALRFLGADDAAVSIQSCRFSHNFAAVSGGAIGMRHLHPLALRTTVFTNNSAVLGGAMFIASGGDLHVIDSVTQIETIPTFEDNFAFDGGAIFADGAGSLDFGKSIFRRNRAERNGGALCVINSDPGEGLELHAVLMSDNTAGAGGAIFAENITSFSVIPGERDRNADFVGEGNGSPTNEFVRYIAPCL